jgi:predicted alpha/beta-fold hydrolase
MREPRPLSNRLHGRLVAGSFRAHPLLRGPHLQTLATLLRPTPRLSLRIERRELPDGDFVDLGWCGEGRGPLVVLLHGLSGGFDAKYARGLARRLLARGWRCVLLQFRGAGPEPNRLPRSYHHGETEDLRELLQMLRAREPATPLYAVGWSLGGNVLLKYLGEDGARAPLTRAVAVCAPFALKPCAERLRIGFSRVYQNHLLGELKQMIRRKHAVVPMEIDLAQALAARDFFEFDDAVTAKINGFRDAEDYYARAACGQFLGGIAVPTLAIHAKDDPFMIPEVVPDAAHLPPAMTLELCEHGGHVGFVAAGPWLAPRFWLEERIPEFFLAPDATPA